MLKELGKVLGLFFILVAAAIFSSISLSAQKVAAIDHFQYINALR
jgi:hypothetical protein